MRGQQNKEYTLQNVHVLFILEAETTKPTVLHARNYMEAIASIAPVLVLVPLQKFPSTLDSNGSAPLQNEVDLALSKMKFQT